MRLTKRYFEIIIRPCTLSGYLSVRPPTIHFQFSKTIVALVRTDEQRYRNISHIIVFCMSSSNRILKRFRKRTIITIRIGCRTYIKYHTFPAFSRLLSGKIVVTNNVSYRRTYKYNVTIRPLPYLYWIRPYNEKSCKSISYLLFSLYFPKLGKYYHIGASRPSKDTCSDIRTIVKEWFWHRIIELGRIFIWMN